eukprot:183620-Rhodomonas_salina.1
MDGHALADAVGPTRQRTLMILHRRTHGGSTLETRHPQSLIVRRWLRVVLGDHLGGFRSDADWYLVATRLGAARELWLNARLIQRDKSLPDCGPAGSPCFPIPATATLITLVCPIICTESAPLKPGRLRCCGNRRQTVEGLLAGTTGRFMALHQQQTQRNQQHCTPHTLQRR